MAQIKVLQLARDDLLYGESGGVIGEVAMPAENTLFETPWSARVILEHFHVVIGFKHKHIRATHSLDNELGRMPKIGQNPDGPLWRAQQEADRIIGVMRDAKGVDDYVARFKCCSRRENVEIEFELQRQFNGFFGQAIAIDRNIQSSGQARETLNVVGMLVRNEDSSEVFDGPPNREQAAANLAAAQAGVDEQARLLGL